MQITFTQAMGTMLPKVNTIIKLDDIYYITKEVTETELDYTLGESQVKISIECDRILRAYAFKDSGFIVFIADNNNYISKEKCECKKENFEGLEVCINTELLDFSRIYNASRYEITVFKQEDVYFDYDKNTWCLKEKDIIPLRIIPPDSLLCATFKQKRIISEDEILISNTPKAIRVDPLPDEENYDFYIVSQQYKTACYQLGKDTSKLITIVDYVYNKDSKVVGCLGFEN